jgi:hypothetical protein
MRIARASTVATTVSGGRRVRTLMVVSFEKMASRSEPSSSCFSVRKDSCVERWAWGQRDDHEGCVETGNLLLGRDGFHVSREFVDAGETLGGVVTFECHVGPCLSRERASIGPSVAARLFNVEQSA